MTAQQAGRVTISAGTSTTVVSPRATYHALLFSEIEIDCSVTVNGVDGSNTEYLMHHPGQGDLVLSNGNDGTATFTTVYVKRVNSDSGVVELKPIDELGPLVPGQFIPAGRVVIEVDSTKSFMRINGGVPGKGSSNTNVVLFGATAANDTGGAFALTTSATLGSKIAINTGYDGLYEIAASLCSGVTLGSTAYLCAGTVNNTLTLAEARAQQTGTINQFINASASVYLAAGNEVYVHHAGALASPNTHANDNQLTICGPL